VTRTTPSLVARRWATLRTDAPSTAIARTILRWLTGRRVNHFEPIVRRQIDTSPRVTSAVAREVDELVAGDRVQPWQERTCRIPGVPLAVQAYEYFLHQIFGLMRTEAHANEARRKRPTQGSRNLFEHAFIFDDLTAPLGPHGLFPTLPLLFRSHLFGSRSATNDASSRTIKSAPGINRSATSG
jgi:hypothetical protein